MASGTIVHYCPSSAFNNGSKDARSFFTDQDLRVSWSVPIISCVFLTPITKHFCIFQAAWLPLPFRPYLHGKYLDTLRSCGLMDFKVETGGSSGAFPWLSWGKLLNEDKIREFNYGMTHIFRDPPRSVFYQKKLSLSFSWRYNFIWLFVRIF